MKYVMTSVVNGDNIYFHCTIGTDRTGTLAYFLEGAESSGLIYFALIVSEIMRDAIE